MANPIHRQRKQASKSSEYNPMAISLLKECYVSLLELLPAVLQICSSEYLLFILIIWKFYIAAHSLLQPKTAYRK